MIILKAEFPAGTTIEQAITEAIDFSAEHGCMLECDLNDIKVPVVSGLLPREKAIRYFRDMYDDSFKRRNETKTGGSNL